MSMIRLVATLVTRPVLTGLNQLRREFGNFRKEMSSGLGQLVTGAALFTGLNALRSSLDRIGDLALRFGESAETMQRVDLAARHAGTTVEVVAQGMQKVTRAAYAATKSAGEEREAFQKLGISVGEFVNMPLAEKLLALARGLEEVRGDGEAIALVMQVLGRGGGELLPLLRQGSEALQESMDAAKVASQGAVDSVMRFNDTLDTIQQAAAGVFGGFLQWVHAVAVIVGGAIGTMLVVFGVFFRFIWENIGRTMSIFQALFKGKFIDAGGLIAESGRAFKRMFDDAVAAAKAGRDSINEALNEIAFGDEAKRKGTRVLDEADAEGEKDAERKAERIAKLKEQLAEKERTRLLRNMEVQERINRLVEEQLALERELARTKDAEKELEIQNQIEDVRKEIEQAQGEAQRDAEAAARDEEQAAEDYFRDMEKAYDDEVDQEQKMADAQQTFDERRRDRKFAALDDEGKKRMLVAEMADLDKRITGESDPLKKLNLQIEREAKLGELEGMGRSKTSRGLAVAADSLARIGGGGGVARSGVDPLLQQQRLANQWLSQIATNTKPVERELRLAP